MSSIPDNTVNDLEESATLIVKKCKERFSWIENDEKIPILFLDLANASENECVISMLLIKEVANAHNSTKMYLLADMSGAEIKQAAIRSMRKRLKDRTQKIVKYGLYGGSRRVKIGVQIANNFSSAIAYHFSSKQLALDYLDHPA